jgi:hypothetical protein
VFGGIKRDDILSPLKGEKTTDGFIFPPKKRGQTKGAGYIMK